MKIYKILFLLLFAVFSTSIQGYCDGTESLNSLDLKAENLALQGNQALVQALSNGDIATYKKAMDYYDQVIKILDAEQTKVAAEDGLDADVDKTLVQSARSLLDYRSELIKEPDFVKDAKDEHDKTIKYNGEKYKVTAQGKSQVEIIEDNEKNIMAMMKGTKKAMKIESGK